MRQVKFYSFHETRLEDIELKLNDLLESLKEQNPSLVSCNYQTAPFRNGSNEFVYHNVLIAIETDGNPVPAEGKLFS